MSRAGAIVLLAGLVALAASCADEKSQAALAAVKAQAELEARNG